MALAVAIAPVSGTGASGEIPDDPATLVRDVELRIPKHEELMRRVAGAELVVASDSVIPLVDVVVAVPSGRRDDPPGATGLAGLTAAMMRRGGVGERTAPETDEKLAELAAEIRIVGLESRSVALLDAPRDGVEEALEVFFDALAEPRFEPGALRLAKQTLVAGLRHRGEDPAELARDAWRRLVLGDDHAAVRPLTATGLGGVTRQDLLDFHRRHWRPERAVVAVSGDLGADEAVELLGSQLERWHEAVGEIPLREAGLDARSMGTRGSDLSTARTGLDPAGLFALDVESPQAVVVLGQRVDRTVVSGSRRDAELRLLGEVLGGGGAVSRLDGRLRAREGLAYDVVAELDVGTEEAGLLNIEFMVEAGRTGRALAAALDELERLRRRAPSELEVDTARRELLAGIQRRFDSAEEVAGSFAEDLLVGRDPGYRTELERHLRGVDAADLRRVALSVLHPSRTAIVVAGPWDEVASSLRTADLPRWLDVDGAVRLPLRDPLNWEPLGPVSEPVLSPE